MKPKRRAFSCRRASHTPRQSGSTGLALVPLALGTVRRSRAPSQLRGYNDKRDCAGGPMRFRPGLRGGPMKRSAPDPSPSAGEIMTVPEAADYLHCHPSTLYRLLGRRKFPGFHLGSDWRFRRADIDAWIAAQQMKVPAEKDQVGELKRAQQPARKKPRRPGKS